MPLSQFFAAVLRGLGVPVTTNNLNKLGAVAKQEGSGGTYNPFNYILGPGTNFNSAGVKNYPDAQTGIAQTVKLLSQKNTSAMRANLASDGPYSGWLSSTSHFYNSWGGGNLNISQSNAAGKLNEAVKGSQNMTAAQSAALAGGGIIPATPSTLAAAAPKADPMNAQAERDALDKYLNTLTPDKKAQTVADIKAQRDLPSLGAYMGTAPPEVNRYINFLASLDKSGQSAETNMLVAPDAQGSQQMTSLLQTLGVSYSNAPNPTPALLAFLNGIGLNLSTAEDVKNRALERIGAATSDAMSDIDRTAGRNKQNITADLVRRNILSSGESTTRYSRQAADVADQQSGVQTTAANSTEDVNNSYRQAQDLARQQALDKIIGAEQDQSTAKAASAAQEDAYRRQQQAAEAANSQSLAAQQAAIKAQEDAMAKYAAQGVAV
jgi:hypothetical protein